MTWAKMAKLEKKHMLILSLQISNKPSGVIASLCDKYFRQSRYSPLTYSTYIHKVAQCDSASYFNFAFLFFLSQDRSITF